MILRFHCIGFTTSKYWLEILQFRRAVHSSHHFFGEFTNQITWFHITNFTVSSDQNVLYNLVTIANLKYISQLNYTAHFGDLKQKNWRFKIGDVVCDFTKKLVTRMDGAPFMMFASSNYRSSRWDSYHNVRQIHR